jgi:threonine dehydratase
MFPIALARVAQALLVSEDAIRQAQAALWDALRVVAEPGAATAFAPLLSRQYRPAPGERVAVVLTGANTTAVNFDG